MSTEAIVATRHLAGSGVPTAGDEWDAGRSGGRLVVAWQNPESRLISPVGVLDHGSRTHYRFRYLRRAAELEGFEPFLSFPDFARAYVATSLFPLFAQRIMSPRRPDFAQFLRQLDLDERATPWEQLARSEGRSSGDTVQVFPVPVVEPSGRSECCFLVHGIRHVTGGRLPELTVGGGLQLVAEPENTVNTAAVKVVASTGESLGYVPDLLLEHLDVLRSAGPVEVSVAHVNGPDAPAHLRVLARLVGNTPPGYRPMSGPRWALYDSE